MISNIGKLGFLVTILVMIHMAKNPAEGVESMWTFYMALAVCFIYTSHAQIDEQNGWFFGVMSGVNSMAIMYVPGFLSQFTSCEVCGPSPAVRALRMPLSAFAAHTGTDVYAIMFLLFFSLFEILAYTSVFVMRKHYWAHLAGDLALLRKDSTLFAVILPFMVYLYEGMRVYEKTRIRFGGRIHTMCFVRVLITMFYLFFLGYMQQAARARVRSSPSKGIRSDGDSSQETQTEVSGQSAH